MLHQYWYCNYKTWSCFHSRTTHISPCLTDPSGIVSRLFRSSNGNGIRRRAGSHGSSSPGIKMSSCHVMQQIPACHLASCKWWRLKIISLASSNRKIDCPALFSNHLGTGDDFSPGDNFYVRPHNEMGRRTWLGNFLRGADRVRS